MKTIVVYTHKPVLCGTEETTSIVFYSIRAAKKWIKENLNNYKSSCVYKIYANGDTVIHGSLDIEGNNKRYAANSRQKQKSY